LLELAGDADHEIEMGGYRGKLHGIPIAVKDTHYTKGLRTTAGSPILDRFVPEFDATVVTKLRQAGAIIIGKTRLPEWSMGPRTPGTSNPWDLTRDPGGSSGGSAAAVAANMLYGATGGDTGGSIRSPATICGVVGLKPTFGRVSCFGTTHVAWSLDHIGPIAKTVEDAALLLHAMAGHDPNDPSSAQAIVPDYTARLRRGVEGWRIGTPRAHLLDRLHPDSHRAFYAALEVFEGLGAGVEEVDLPPTFEVAQACQRVIRLTEAAAYHRGYLQDPAADYGPSSVVRPQVLAGSLLPAAAYERAQQVRGRFIRELRELFRDVDVFVCPARDAPAHHAGDSDAGVFSTMWNLSGFPAIAVPAGFSTDPPGLPVGIQIAGRPFEEEAILAAAHAFEQATEWHRRKPVL